MAKLHATEAAQQVIDEAVQMHGGAGVTRGVKVEELYREIRALRIYEGASEVQRQIIARDLLKEARHEDPATARLAAAQGLFQRHQRARPDDLHRRRRRLGRAGEFRRAPASPASSRQALRNTLAILAEDGAGPEHIVRMTCYVTDVARLSRQPRRDRRGVEASDGHATIRRWRWSRSRAWSSRAAEIEIEATAVVPDD